MADASVKIRVDGEKEFRDSMKNCAQAGKTLDAQMNQLASQFDTTTNKEEAYSKASNILTSQIENQKKQIDLLKDAVAKSTDKYGENSTQTLKLQEQLAKAETSLSKLESTSVDAALGVDKLGEEEKETEAQTESASNKMSAFAVALGNLAADAIKDGIRFIKDSVKAIAEYFIDATKGAAAYADEILTLSSQTSLSTQTLQEYRYMADLTDTSLETITGSLTKLTKNMDAARDGSASAAAAFDTLGISVTNSDGTLRTSDEVFQEAITALGSISNEAERDALAMNIFGKSAKDLNPLIEAGGDAIEAFRQEAQDMGYVLDTDTLEKMGAVQDGFDRLGLAAESAKNQIGAAIGQFILPYLNQLVGAVQALVGSGDVDKFVSEISGMLNGLLNEIASALPSILKAGGEIIGKLIMGINDMLPKLVPVALDVITQLSNFLIDNLPTIVETATKIIIALVTGIGNALPELIPAAIQAILTIVEGLTSHIGDLITAALTLIAGLVEGLTSPEGINSIIQAIPTIIQGIITGIIENLPQIIAAGVSIIGNLIIGLIQAIPTLLGSTQEIITAIVNAFQNTDWSAFGKQMVENVGQGISSMWSNIKQVAIDTWGKIKEGLQVGIDAIKSIGDNLVKGLWNGINDAKDWILGKIKGFGESIIGGVKKVFGIQSPSKVMENEVGKQLGAGLARGIEESVPAVEKATKDLIGAVGTTSAKQTKEVNKKLKSDVASVTKNYIDGVAKINNELDKNIAKLEETYAKSVESRKNSIVSSLNLFDDVKLDEARTKQELAMNLQNQVAALAEWDEILTKLQKRLGKNSPLYQELQSMGVSSLDTLRVLDSMSKQELNSYVQLYAQKLAIAADRAESENADLLKETNKQIDALQKEAAKQTEALRKTYVDELNALGFDMGHASMDVGMQIAAGIDKGWKDGAKSLSTDMQDEIEGILDQIKSMLGIHSPSKVFANQVGKWMPLGIAQGFAAAMPRAENSILSSIDSMVPSIRGNVFDDLSSAGSVTNMGGVNIVVNAAEGQSANDIANMVMKKMQSAVNSRKAVFA